MESQISILFRPGIELGRPVLSEDGRCCTLVMHRSDWGTSGTLFFFKSDDVQKLIERLQDAKTMLEVAEEVRVRQAVPEQSQRFEPEKVERLQYQFADGTPYTGEIAMYMHPDGDYAVPVSERDRIRAGGDYYPKARLYLVGSTPMPTANPPPSAQDLAEEAAIRQIIDFKSEGPHPCGSCETCDNRPGEVENCTDCGRSGIQIPF